MQKQKIQAHISNQIITSNNSEAYSLQQKSGFGENTNGKIQYSLAEALYLIEKGKLEVLSSKSKSNTFLKFNELMNKFKKIDKKFHLKYIVFEDLREKGYIVKTALKFGADFRVYDKGQKPGKSHAKWLVFVEHESSKLAMHEFSAKNRVAHSTKKSLLLAIVDEESSVSYYEVNWKRI